MTAPKQARPGPKLPDSYDPAGLCPHCGYHSSFEVSVCAGVEFDTERYVLQHDGTQERIAVHQVSVLMCRHCRQGVAVIEEQWVGDLPARRGGHGGAITYRGVHWWPRHAVLRSEDIPTAIRDVVDEAGRCLTAGCPRAAAVMGRRALEAVTDGFGFASGVLAKRLESMEGSGKLHQSLAGWAKEVRLIGNAGAHFDPAQDVSDDDAAQLLSFLEELLRYLYVLPAELERHRS